jgi:hypothetical protein
MAEFLPLTGLRALRDMLSGNDPRVSQGVFTVPLDVPGGYYEPLRVGNPIAWCYALERSGEPLLTERIWRSRRSLERWLRDKHGSISALLDFNAWWNQHPDVGRARAELLPQVDLSVKLKTLAMRIPGLSREEIETLLTLGTGSGILEEFFVSGSEKDLLIFLDWLSDQPNPDDHLILKCRLMLEES